jgi:hypothetical protein
MTDDQHAGAATGTVTDLRLVAVTPDRSHLVLEDSGSRQFRVPVDERLAAALRSERTRSDRSRPGQLEIALESQLSPREIQARIRAGHSVDEVSHAAGISADRVERYASPVIAERRHVVEQAQLAPARRASAGKAPLLVELVESRLGEQQAAKDTVEWDASRGDDDRWTVRLSYLAGGRARVATWAFDPRGRVLAPADDEARWLVEGSGADRDADEPPAAVRRLTAVPGGEADAEARSVDARSAEARSADEVYDREADEARAAQAEPVRQVAAGRAGRRPPVPSWDDIMFGTRKRD